MKTLKNLSFIVLAIMLVLTSCTMEKRIHRSGYHIELLTDKHKGHSGNYKNCSLCSPLQKESSEQLDETTIATEPSVMMPTKTDDCIDVEVSAHNDQIILPSEKPKNNWLSKIVEPQNENLDKKKNIITPSTKMSSETKNLIYDKKLIKSKLKESKKNRSSEGASGALKGIGWAILILGLLILLFVNILVGAGLMLLGLIFVMAGAESGGSSPKEKTNDKSENVDVVYLKNGSVIRGIIIELIPNVSIKIQTKDGSIFFYKMEEIEKITKELSK